MIVLRTYNYGREDIEILFHVKGLLTIFVWLVACF